MLGGVATLSDLLAEHTELPADAAAQLQRLVAEWQLLSDLTFADYALAVRGEGGALVYVAQVRPNTATTLLQHDLVGHSVDGPDSPLAANPLIERALRSGRIEHELLPIRIGGLPVDRMAVPVSYAGEVIGVLGRVADASGSLPPSPLESAYRDAAGILCQMVVEGSFPTPEANTLGLSTPRAGDGFIRIDEDGRVVYASPNSLSALHRMGWTADLGNTQISDVFADLLADRFEAADLLAMIEVVRGAPGAPDLPPTELALRRELDAARANVLLRAVPLRSRGQARGAILLIRDVTEVKRRDLALISKDATIREIHHRVKNNLQSVSALLRLQARRSANPETMLALGEAVRRVSSIALVHEMLSGSVDEEVDLDAVLDRLAPTLLDVGLPTGSGAQATIVRSNRLGVLPAERAMPLVMVLTEVIQNAIEHAFDPGAEDARIEIDAQRDVRRLVVTVVDNGRGLPAGFDMDKSDRLGLQIVRTLVSNDLDGSVTMANDDGGGTSVVLDLPLRRDPGRGAPA